MLATECCVFVGICLVAHVSPVLCQRLTRFTRCKGFLWCGVFGGVILLVFSFAWFGLVSPFAFAPVAFVPSLTGAQRTDSSPATKK